MAQEELHGEPLPLLRDRIPSPSITGRLYRVWGAACCPACSYQLEPHTDCSLCAVAAGICRPLSAPTNGCSSWNPRVERSGRLLDRSLSLHRRYLLALDARSAEHAVS